MQRIRQSQNCKKEIRVAKFPRIANSKSPSPKTHRRNEKRRLPNNSVQMHHCRTKKGPLNASKKTPLNASQSRYYPQISQWRGRIAILRCNHLPLAQTPQFASTWSPSWTTHGLSDVVLKVAFSSSCAKKLSSGTACKMISPDPSHPS